MIRFEHGIFKLDTPNTSYLIRITETGHPEHLYYGPRMNHVGDISAFLFYSDLRMPTIVNYSNEEPRTYLTLVPLEYSSHGKGDLREIAFTGVYGESGNTVFDFIFDSYRIKEDMEEIAPWLPSARKEHSQTLVLELTDQVTGLRLDLLYTVYEDSDVIVRRCRLRNEGSELLMIRSLYSLQLDLPDEGFEAITFDGAWMREREMHTTPLTAGTFGVQSLAGVSGAEHNPLFCLKKDGQCYLFNLLWSGDHREIAEVSPYGTVRVLTGVNPSTFSWKLRPGENFVSPEAIMVYSEEGENGVSEQAHEFVRRYISSLNWQGRERPILLNSWEGMGFHLSEENIKRQAEAAAELGMELFVIDDGWFRKNSCARGDMGDWEVDRRKFPRGLRPVCEKIHALGMMAGIWIEPEMISPDSQLYHSHPEYLVRCPGRVPSPGRDQYILDMTNDETVDEIFRKLEKLIGENGFDYVKWDMNRYLSDDHSSGVWGPEFRYRWTLGLYRLLRRLTARFPELLIEGCASGGGRYDLGILCYVNQFWGSDNTDATDRVSIFTGTVSGYPQETFGAHVSRIPNNLTGRVYDYETAFHVNAFGAFGYELDVTRLSEFERRMFRDQIAFYKKYRRIFQFGKLWRFSSGNDVIWISEDTECGIILALYLEKRMTFSRKQIRKLIVPSCKPDKLYQVTARRQWVTNPLMCEKRGGIHQSEDFSCIVSGALLRCQGMSLMPVFLGTDYREEAAYLGDYGSRLFIIEESGLAHFKADS